MIAITPVRPYDASTTHRDIIDEIHSWHLQKSLKTLREQGSVEIRSESISRKCFELSEPLQTYLHSKGCSKDRDVRVLLELEKTREKIEKAFCAGLSRTDLYIVVDGYSEMFDDPQLFIGYRFTYKPPLESKRSE